MLKWIAGRLKGAAAPTSPMQRARDLRARGDFEAARGACMEILREHPDQQTDAMALLAALAADQGYFETGMQWAKRTLDTDPGCIAAHFALGRLHEGAQHYAEAESCYRQAVRLDPGHAKAHTNLGCMLHIQGRLDEAAHCYRKALALEPGQPEALRNYALVAGDSGQLREAVVGFEYHLAAHPGDASAHHQLAHLYVGLARYQEALAGYERAIALQPDEPEFHFGRANLLLLLGRYQEGWREYEWRWRMERFNAPMRRFTQPRWDGRRLDQGTLLVHGETGLGDTLQFVRYAALAAERCDRVIVECQPALKDLVADATGVSDVVPQGEPLPPFDAHIPLIAFPGVFETTIDTIPWRGPYIRPDPLRVARWSSAIAACSPLTRKVGLVWTGNPDNLGNQERSVSLQQLGVLAAAPDTTFFSLQKGVLPAQRGPVPDGMHFVDLTGEVRDFSDTAGLLAHLDLVITVDTSVLHLAGAMGRRTWALLPFSPPWRYHVGRSENPWYPDMRLFRQESEGDWSAPLQALSAALQERP